MNVLKRAALGLAVIVLASCGGGGASSSGGSGGTGSTPAIDISLTPASMRENLVQGLSLDLQLSAVAQVVPGATLSGTVFVLIVDDKGVIEPNVTVTGSGSNYSATLVTNPGLSVGDHQGSILIEACADAHCSTVYGSTKLSYDFKVSSATNLKALSALAGASDWQPLNGNAQRAAYEPVTLDASTFSSRWLYMEPAVQGMPTQSDFVGAGEFVLNSTNTVTTDSANQLVVLADGPWLIALKETDGTAVWSSNVDPNNFGNPMSPALANGILYTTQGTSNAGRPGAELSTYDEATGAAGLQASYSPNQCLGCSTGPVTVAGGQVFLEPDGNGDGGDLFVFDAGTGSLTWVSPNGVNTARGYALDSTDVYFVDDNLDGLVALDQPTGTVQFSIGSVGEKLLSLDGAGGAIAYTGSELEHVDLSTQSVDWSTPALTAHATLTSSAIGNGMLYAATTGFSSPVGVTAYSTADGHLLWSWSPPAGDGSTEPLSMIATDNLLFVGTDAQTYAIDVNTHAVVWSYPLGGGLSISPSGILYIQGSGAVAAINLH